MSDARHLALIARPEKLMGQDVISTDYLVVGCGQSGMGFVDSLLDVSDANIVMVDRRTAPGGHWLDAYPFVRLHLPSVTYGMGSTTLGAEHVQTYGREAGMYERATGSEIVGHFDAVMQQRFLASGRVRFLAMTEYVGDGTLRSSVTGDVTRVEVRRKTVDATRAGGEVPATYPAPFEVADGVRLVTPSQLGRLQEPASGYVVVGGGKTAMDACMWLLDQGCRPDRITWVRARDLWFNNRFYLQPGHLARHVVDGTASIVEAVARAATVDEAYEYLEERGVIFRLDPSVWPTVFRGASCSEAEMEQLRTIRNVVRLGRVRRIEPESIVLDEGSVATSPENLHVHCAAPGLPVGPARPVFAGDTITIATVTRTSIAMSSAAIARIESLDISTAAKNRLSPPMPPIGHPVRYLQTMLSGLAAELAWREYPSLRDWADNTRLSLTKRYPGQEDDADSKAARARLKESAGAAFENIARLVADVDQAEASAGL